MASEGFDGRALRVLPEHSGASLRVAAPGGRDVARPRLAPGRVSYAGRFRPACRTSTPCGPTFGRSTSGSGVGSRRRGVPHRLERFFTELRDPLAAVYGDDPRLEGEFAGLLEAIAPRRTPARRTCARLDHEREITPDWLQREQALGYVAYADRFAGTLQRRARAAPVPARARRVSYLHLMPLLQPRPEPNDGGYAVVDYGAVEPALGTMDDLRALARRPARATGWRCASTSWSTTPRASTRGRRRRSPATSEMLACYRTFARPRRSPTPTSRRCPRSSPTSRPAASPTSRSSAAGCGRRSTTFQWDLDYTNPAVFRAMAEAMLDARERRRRRAAPRRRAVPVEAHGHRQPEPARGPPAAAGVPRRAADRRSRRGVQGRGDRLPARPRALPRRGPSRGQGVRPRLPQRAHGPGLERARLAARSALLTHTLQAMPPVAARRRAG